MHWINLAQGTYTWQVFMEKIINIRLSLKGGICLLFEEILHSQEGLCYMGFVCLFLFVCMLSWLLICWLLVIQSLTQFLVS